jgi:uncharacterized protein (TIGR00251 family)
MCARGDSYFRRKINGLTTGDTGNTGARGESLRQVVGFSRSIPALPVETSMLTIHTSPKGVAFAIKVHPRAKKNAITGEVGDALKVALTAPPVDGKANEACIEFFAKLLKVPRSSVTIASGQSSRNKVILVAGMSARQVQSRFGL